MRRALFISLVFCALPLGAAEPRPVQVGQVWADVQPTLDEPESRLESGGRAIYRWPDREVWVVNGKVTRVIKRDRVREQAAEVRRSEAADAALVREALILAEEAEVAAEARARADLESPERERRDQEAKAEREKQQREEEARRAAEARKTERAVKIAVLGKEMTALRLAITRARQDGDSEKVARLRGVLLAKDDELRVLQAEP